MEFSGYQWYCNGNPISGATQQFYSAGQSTKDLLHIDQTYSVEITLANGDKLRTCEAYPVVTEKSDVQVYPNPVQKGRSVYVVVPDESYFNAEIRIYSITGQFIKSQRIDGLRTEVNLNLNLPTGTYIVQVKDHQIKLVITEF
jgi:hypothetical protein